MLSTKHRTWYIIANEWRYDEDGDDDSNKDEGFDGVIQVCTMKTLFLNPPQSKKNFPTYIITYFIPYFINCT